jgi:hypothetical protein
MLGRHSLVLKKPTRRRKHGSDIPLQDMSHNVGFGRELSAESLPDQVPEGHEWDETKPPSSAPHCQAGGSRGFQESSSRQRDLGYGQPLAAQPQEKQVDGAEELLLSRYFTM